MAIQTQTRQIYAKSLSAPDQTIPFAEMGRIEVVSLGETTALRATFQPGFRWTQHARPTAGTDLCQVRHVGYVLSGRAGIRMADGTERVVAAGDAFDVPAGHDSWVIGDEPYVSLDFAPTEAPAEPPREEHIPPRGHRILLENDRVRVLEVRIKPGESSGMHSHPKCVVYQLSPARVRFTLPDGTSRIADSKVGDVIWSEGGWHEVENVGTTDDLGIIVELKR